MVEWLSGIRLSLPSKSLFYLDGLTLKFYWLDWLKVIDNTELFSQAKIQKVTTKNRGNSNITWHFLRTFLTPSPIWHFILFITIFWDFPHTALILIRGNNKQKLNQQSIAHYGKETHEIRTLNFLERTKQKIAHCRHVAWVRIYVMLNYGKLKGGLRLEPRNVSGRPRTWSLGKDSRLSTVLKIIIKYWKILCKHLFKILFQPLNLRMEYED